MARYNIYITRTQSGNNVQYAVSRDKSDNTVMDANVAEQYASDVAAGMNVERSYSANVRMVQIAVGKYPQNV